MFKSILCLIGHSLLIADALQLIRTNYSSHSTVSNFIKTNSTLSHINKSKSLNFKNLNSSKSVRKRSANIFEDDDQNKANNVDYIDFNGMYKDEVPNVREVSDQELKNKRTIGSRSRFNRRRKKRRRKKHRPFRFKRKGESRLLRVPLKSSYPDLIQYGVDHIKPKLLGVQFEDSYHRIVQHVLPNHDGNLNDNDLKPDDEEIDNESVNKVLDKLTSNHVKPHDKNVKEEEPTTQPPTKKKPNYFGNFHLIIRIPKDRNLDDLQNLTLVASTDSKQNQKNLDEKLEQLKNSIDKLTIQMETNSGKKILNVVNNRPNKQDFNDLNKTNRPIEMIYSNNLDSKNTKFKKLPTNGLKSRKMICLKRPPANSTFCYML